MWADLPESFYKLKACCEGEVYRGWGPYDGLNSRLFHFVPFLHDSRLARLIWIQLFKPNPLNLIRPAMVPRESNHKGVALFLNGYCHLYEKDPGWEYKS